MTKGGNKRAELPTRQQVLDYIRGSEIPVGKREIARAFGIKGADRIPLKAMLKDLEHAGEIDRGRHRRMGAPGALPEVTVLTVLGPDTDGELMAARRRAATGRAPRDRRGEAPRIFLVPDRTAKPAYARGDRVLARLRRLDETSYEARVIRRLRSAPAAHRRSL